MSRVLEVPYGQLGDMTKRQAMNLSVLRVDDGTSLSTTYEQAKKLATILPTTSPNAPLLKSRAPHKFDDAPAAPLVRDVAFARWEVLPLPGNLTLDEVLHHVVKVNTGNTASYSSKTSKILKIKVRFSDASEITFVRQDVSKPDSLKYSGFYSALSTTNESSGSQNLKSFNPLANSASAAFQKRGPVRLPELSLVDYPTKEQRVALFKRMDPNGNGILSLAELDKSIIELWPRFNNKAAIMRAYKASDLDGSGLLSFGEFEHFLRYLVNFTKVWETFAKIDSNRDKRVSMEEYVAAGKILEPSKTEAELIANFRKLDTNGGGFILFEEFCASMVEKRSNIIGPIPPQPMNRLAMTAPLGSRNRVSTKSKRVATLEMPTAARRKQIFTQMDPNGNGMCSLAELDKGILEIFPAFNNKPAIMRAYKAADANNTGFISKGEFEYFLRYLVHFNNLWAAFAEVDADGDRRISLQEFLAVRDRLQVGNETEARQAFSAMDRNRGGFVLFEEFCDWMAKNKAQYEIQFTQASNSPARKSGVRKAAALPAVTAPVLVLPTGAERDALWKRADFNGNGMCSLAELDKVVVELWPRFNNKPAIMRAYKACDKNGTGFVSRKEFNMFLSFIVHFNTLWTTFASIDRDRDRRVSLQEFLTGAGVLNIKNASEAQLTALFQKMDVNRGGLVLFDEFCAALAELKAKSD